MLQGKFYHCKCSHVITFLFRIISRKKARPGCEWRTWRKTGTVPCNSTVPVTLLPTSQVNGLGLRLTWIQLHLQSEDDVWVKSGCNNCVTARDVLVVCWLYLWLYYLVAVSTLVFGLSRLILFLSLQWRWGRFSCMLVVFVTVGCSVKPWVLDYLGWFSFCLCSDDEEMDEDVSSWACCSGGVKLSFVGAQELCGNLLFVLQAIERRRRLLRERAQQRQADKVSRQQAQNTPRPGSSKPTQPTPD